MTRQAVQAISLLVLSSSSCVEGFFGYRYPTFTRRSQDQYQSQSSFSPASASSSSSALWIYAPPGSGYARPEDEEDVLPLTYEPMMEFPGTMRPGKTPENVPFQDLPIGDSDPDPVPWPHFQQIEWHHQWDPPHDHPIPMEEFIDLQGRWATPEMEAAMRAGVRQSVRERREMEESEQRDTIITDDADDDAEENDEPVALGDGIYGQLGSDADKALTAAATAPPVEGAAEETETAVEEETGDDGLDDFLLDLGLDLDLDLDSSGSGSGTDDTPKDNKGPAATSSADKKPATQDELEDDDDDEDEDVSSSTTSKAIEVDDDIEDDIEDLESDGADTVPLEDFGGDDSDQLDTEDIFDEGGFDYDEGEGGDFDGGDSW
jgi:hypothetical protein